LLEIIPREGGNIKHLFDTFAEKRAAKGASAARENHRYSRSHRRRMYNTVVPDDTVTKANPIAVPRRIEPEDLIGAEWAEWYRLSPQERWAESMRLWSVYLAHGGSLDPEPDTQSPFFFPDEERPRSGDGRSGLRFIRRSGV
jgi:hypothetical protein